jgi:hypothetical protein
MSEDVLKAIRDLRTGILSDVRHAVSESESRIRSEMLDHFDHVYYRFDRLETEMVALKRGLHRVEDRVEAR